MKSPRKHSARSSWRKTAVSAVSADGHTGCRQRKITETGWKPAFVETTDGQEPVGRDRQDAYPPITNRNSRHYREMSTADYRHFIEELSQLVREMISQVPWGLHANARLRVSNPAARLWYLRATAHFGWFYNVYSHSEIINRPSSLILGQPVPESAKVTKRLQPVAKSQVVYALFGHNSSLSCNSLLTIS